MVKVILALTVLLLVTACAPYYGPRGYSGGYCGGGYWGSPATNMNMTPYTNPSMGSW
ncbi:hypothetical protein DFW101_3750 (plasmid) [Solidesulfovibrio carbinoliphilus subsp. oakridgensis]|jgi:hypothetical protein|uniref:Lipoprotein n=2 Tax=Solidesulfovibrio TaxID=2910984 RepID=G7QED9_9BACT|nr:hypothetical protein DFW101_3750 [Solidesulfovibrio carbinoliphilus subsp. oakridgensis]EKO41246.1 MAG: hypothetical protein B193_0016 [Solidesulfovibrio magneticus str. Maddingley MBC34]